MRKESGGFRIGDRVRLVDLPPTFGELPEETRTAFTAARGGVFEVRGFGPYGHLEIELGRELDTLLGGFMNTLWVEPECVRHEAPEPPPGSTPATRKEPPP
jgi:hypothetical protein